MSSERPGPSGVMFLKVPMEKKSCGGDIPYSKVPEY